MAILAGLTNSGDRQTPLKPPLAPEIVIVELLESRQALR